MNKTLSTALMCIMILVLVTACGGEDDSYNSDWQGTMSSSQGIQIERADNGEILTTVNEEKVIEGFINDLEIDKWEAAELQEDSEKEFTIKFFKEGTVNTNGDESNENDTQTVVCRITTYKDSSIITLESLGLDLAFRIPERALNMIDSFQ